MLDTPTSQNIGDFKQRYLGVFGWLCQDVKRLVYISSVNSTRVAFTDEDGSEYFVNINSGINFEFAPVVRGWYNTSQGAHYMCRVPARQWKRGISEENTFISKPGGIDFGLAGDQWKKAVFVILNSPEMSIAPPYTGAFSRHFANLHGNLYLYNKLIGSVKDNTAKLSSDLFRQEFSDMCRRKNLELEVV